MSFVEWGFCLKRKYGGLQNNKTKESGRNCTVIYIIAFCTEIMLVSFCTATFHEDFPCLELNDIV
jgi:hypothetical protein